jgi:hypothetical protein
VRFVGSARTHSVSDSASYTFGAPQHAAGGLGCARRLRSVASTRAVGRLPARTATEESSSTETSKWWIEGQVGAGDLG